MLSILVNILLFILVIGFLTFIHELGHFLSAKLVKAKVYEFSLGFGPKLLSKKYKGTLYCIRIIPLGGFVKILGDGDPGEYEKGKDLNKSEYNLNNKPKVVQMFVMLAGVFMNIIFAILFYYIILGLSSWKTSPIYINMEGIDIVGVEVRKVVGYEVAPESNAEIAGLPQYGIISEVDGERVTDRDGLINSLKAKERVDVLVCNDSLEGCSNYDVEVDEEGKIGIFVSHGYILDYENVKLSAGGVYLINNLKIISRVLGSMIGTARETGDYSELSNTVSGPIGIFLLIDNLKSRGIVVFLSLIADLSISLAIMNLLPVPALDGGRVLILLIEGMFRKDLDERIEAIIINISMAFLIILIILIMIKDVVNIDNMRNMFG
jgi:regulator of sigma E protease